MNGETNYGLYALAVATALVGTPTSGVPARTLFVLTIAAACPLMMFLTMRGTHHGGPGQDTERPHQPHTHGYRRHGADRP